MIMRTRTHHRPARSVTTPDLLLSLYASFILILGTTSFTAEGIVLYNDGESHSIQTSMNDAISLRSSSALTLPPGDYTIRSPPGADSSIRLYMSSVLNATGGDIIGADASEDHPAAAAGVIVGSASRAEFNNGVTVRGGSHLGMEADDYLMDPSSKQNNNKIVAVIATNDDDVKGRGGDALISQYLGSNVTIHGGNFLAGRGSIRDGHSLRASYDGAEIHVLGGTYYGSWMAQSGGTIVAYGCLSRIGTRLVGRLGEDGRHSLDVQVFEEGGGKVVVNSPESCNRYRRKPASSAVSLRVGESGVYRSLFGLAVLLCWSFVPV